MKIHLLSPCECSRRILTKLLMTYRRAKITFRSFTYNEHCNFYYVIDTFLEPMFWFVDNYVRYFGPIFVGFLISMMGAVIITGYLVIIPYEMLRKSYIEIVLYLSFGHLLLVNTVFHYTMAYRTKPGFPPEGYMVVEAVGFCKHCIAPKPPRTHHCSICNRCILKMDHHCPWLNQCVGHFNHRYFFFTMFYMWAACVLLSIGMWPSFAEHYWNYDDPVAPWCQAMHPWLFYSSILCNDNDDNTKNNPESPDYKHEDKVAAVFRLDVGVAAHNCIMFDFLISIAMVVGLGLLMCWHVRLIGRGETSIEQHINKETRKKWKIEGKKYVNPYDFGWKENWRILFGLTGNGRTFWRHLLLPSTHKPEGDGLVWRTATYNYDSDIVAPHVIRIENT